MNGVDQSAVHTHPHLSYGSRKGERQSQFPLLSSLNFQTSNQKVLTKPNAFSPASTVLHSSRSSVPYRSFSRSHSPTEIGKSRESVRFARIQQTRVPSSGNNAIKPKNTDTTGPSLPSLLKNSPNIQEPRKNASDGRNCGKSRALAPPITESVNDDENVPKQSENSIAHNRCDNCGSTFHKNEEHFSDNVVDKEEGRRICMPRRRRPKRNGADRRGIDNSKRSETKRTRTPKNLEDSSPMNYPNTPGAASKNDGSKTKVLGYRKTSVRKITNRRNFTFHYGSSTGKTTMTRNFGVPDDLKEVPEKENSESTKDENKIIKPNTEENSCKTYKLNSKLLGSKDNVESTKVKIAETQGHGFSKSKTLLSKNMAIRNNTKKAEDAGNRRAHFAQNRSVTIHAPGSHLDATGTQIVSQRAGTTRENVPLSYHNLNAYRSIARIPDYSRLKPTSAKQATVMSAACPLQRRSNSVETKKESANSRSRMLSMKELTNYRTTLTIYLDAKWKKTRKDRFYHTLEVAQVKQWKEKKLATVREQRNAQKSKDKQLKQLCFIRDKHQNRRNARLSTQHVKWKYVLRGVGSDRAEYGLPSEYYTYYGFTPDHNNSSKRKNITVNMPRTGTTRSATKARLGEGRDSMLPTEHEMEELRKRNKERYDHIFATRSRTQIDIIRNIIRNGLYTVEIEEEVDEREQTPTGNPSRTEISVQTNSKPQLLKRTSRLVVKDVVNDAKRMLDVLDETYSDDVESKSSGDETDHYLLGK